jgi:hypothetical protein
MSENLFCAGQRYATEAFRANWERIFSSDGARYVVCLNTIPSNIIECYKSNGNYREVQTDKVIDNDLIITVYTRDEAVKQGVI